MGYNYTPPGTPPGNDSGKTNWAKIAAILSAAASLVAVLTWLGISGSSPSPSPAANTPPPNQGTYSSPYQPTDSATNAANSPNPGGTAPNLAQSALPSAACQPAEAAVTAFKNNAGTTWASREDAAMRAVNQLEAVMSSGAVTSQLLYSDFSTLINDFTNLRNTAMGQADSAYNQVLTTTNTDAQNLWSDCGSG